MSLKSSIVSFFENLYYRPRRYHWIVAFSLLPLSLLYGSVQWIRRRLVKPKDPGIPVVSVGNLQVGGSGKTPMTIALARRFDNVAVVLRGYGRKSRGLRVVSRCGTIECGVEEAGDEAMLLARLLPKATVIVAEDRLAGIERAKALGAKAVFLDDGFSKVGIKKFEILLQKPQIPNPLPLPSGPFREFLWEKKSADLVLTEEKDFRRIVTCEGCDEAPLMLVTAIADPARLEPYLPPNIVGRYILPDHAWFDKEAIRRAMAACGAGKILTTEKDWVKLEAFDLPVALLRLDLKIDPNVFDAMEKYIRD